MNDSKIDLAALNKLVKELNDDFAAATSFKEGGQVNNLDYLTALSKCMGLATAVLMEATALTHDYMKAVKLASVPPGVLTPEPAGLSADIFDMFKKKN